MNFRRPQLQRTHAYAYAYVYVISVFLGQTVRFFVGSDPVVGAQSAQIMIPVIGAFIAVLLWLASPADIQAPRGLLGFTLGLLFGVWVWAMIRDWGGVDLTAFTLGPFLLMLMFKTPTRATSINILNVLGILALSLFAIAAVFAIATGVSPTGYTTKWPPLTDPFEPIGMWWAPFNGPAESGAIGAVIIVLGIAQRNALRYPFVIGGGVMLFYGGTLSAALGLGIALLVLMLAYARVSVHKIRIRALAAAMVIGGIGILALELVNNPTLSSRTYIWSDFINMVRAEPIWGWGSAQLAEWEQTQSGPGDLVRMAHGSDAHNLIFDAWVRYGIFVTVALIVALSIALVLAYRSWRLGNPIGLALVAMFLAIGLTEGNVWWGSPGTAYVILLLALMSTNEPSNKRSSSQEERAHESVVES